MISCHDNLWVDIDRDGIKDIVSLSNHEDHPVLAWYRIPADYTSNWDYHKIGGGIHGGIAPLGNADIDNDEDMDNDGDPDIIEAEADTKSGRVFWFENRDNAAEFIYHPISDDPTNQDFHSLAIADFDGDGDLDVLSGGGPLSTEEFKLFIWENLDGDASSWKEHLILTGKRIHEAVAADVDQDGDIDVCTKPWNGSLHFFLENKLK